ncbi:oligosaccharyltransferase complex subunit OSTC isoform 2-T2 [Ammospiza maritima maritima]
MSLCRQKKSQNLSFKPGSKFLVLCLVCPFRKGSVSPCQDAQPISVSAFVSVSVWERGGGGGGSGQRRQGAAGPRPPRDRTAAMETLYRLPFAVLECPNIKLKRPSWVHMPSAMTVYALVVVSYFLITGGIIYDVIVEPPSVGSMTDEHGHQRPVAFLAYRVNGQYIMEGLASSFLFTMGGLGFIILDRSNAPNIPKLNRFLLLFIGFGLLDGLVPLVLCESSS